MEYLFFRKKNNIIFSFCSNIYVLYQKMHKSDFTEDIVTVLQRELQDRQDNSLKEYMRSDFSEIFLFFDYDCHNQNLDKGIPLETTNSRLTEMLAFFNNETENGKLYINYPMVESIRYTRQLPDHNFNSYTVPVSSCVDFKQMTNDFSYYGNLDFISFRLNKQGALTLPSRNTAEKIEGLKENWNTLKNQHVLKAFFICTGAAVLPEKKVPIDQEELFTAQLTKYVQTDNTVAILNSFPLFLYDYL